MKIGTYNLHFGGNGGVLKHWSALVDDYGLDVLLVQESLPPARYGRRAEGQALWRQVPGNDWGTALFTRLPLQQELSLPSFEGWVVGGILGSMDNAPFAVFSVHTPSWPGKSYVKLVHQILDEMAALRLDFPVVLGGDFNLLSAGQRLSSEPLKTKPDEAAVLRRLEEEFGVCSCWSRANPDKALEQTLRWTRNKTAPYHCDALFVPKEWHAIECVVLSGAEWDRLSDHNPVLAVVEPRRALHDTGTGV